MTLQPTMRNKVRITLLVGCLITGIIIIYRTLGEGSVTPDYQYQKDSDRPKDTQWRQTNLENVNDLMELTKSTKRANNKQVVYESEVLTKPGYYQDKVDTANKYAGPTYIAQKSKLDQYRFQSNNKILDQNNNVNPKFGHSLTHILAHKIVHLDLKGAPPRISYYEQIFPLFAKLGVTGLLIEYEDMFPYWGSLRDLSAYNAYSQRDVKRLLQLAKKFNFEIIPLIQTFGHMEFVLKQSTFMDLREVSTYPQVICPSQNRTTELSRMMIDQIMGLHPHIRWLHIGADEVYYLGNCNHCLHKMTTMMWDKNRLFMEHVKSIAKYVKTKHAVQPIMWDDMFRKIPEDEILSSGIYKHVEIMAWRYNKDIVSELPPDVWSKYGNLFTGVWVASAFKGATGPSQYLTPISHHLDNHLSWLQTVEAYHHHIPFRGIAITGWQRYDHFAVLCELLPAAIPSLAVNLLLIQAGVLDSTLLSRATQVLDCTQPINLDPDTSMIVRCGYPGGHIYEGMQQLYNINQEVIAMTASNHMSGWLNQYNIDMHFSSPALVETAYQKLQELKRNLSLLRDDMEHALAVVYDQYVVAEWLRLHLYPLEKKCDAWLDAARELQMQEVWPRRPLIINQTVTSIRPRHHGDTL